MKVCLIQSPVPELLDDRLDPPVGLLYMATLLNRYGEEALVVDLSGIPQEQWEQNIPDADFYGFSTYTASYHRTLRLLDRVRRVNPNAGTIAGGPHATARPAEAIGSFDHVVVGDGARAIVGIVSGALGGGIIAGDPVVYLDELPYPDYGLVDIASYNREFEGKFAFPIFSSRGCPFRCAFCSASVTSCGSMVRRRTPENVVGEIESLRDEYGDVAFRFKDDLFGTSLPWLGSLAPILPDIEYSCNIRGNCRPEVLDVLRATGCKWVCVGAESGDNSILRAMNKGLVAEQTERTVREAKNRGMKVLGWFIVGFPGETWDSVKRTVELIERANFDKVVVYPLIPYPGTAVGDNPDAYGIRIVDRHYSHYFYIEGDYEAGFVYETDDLSPGLIREMRQYVIENLA